MLSSARLAIIESVGRPRRRIVGFALLVTLLWVTGASATRITASALETATPSATPMINTESTVSRTASPTASTATAGVPATSTPTTTPLVTATQTALARQTTSPTPSQMVTVTTTPAPPIREKAVPNPLVDLSMAPRTTNVLGANQEIDIDLVVRAGSQNVTAGAFYVDFDPKALQVVAFGAPTGGGTNPFPISLFATVDNTLGQARYDAGASFGSSGPNGYFRAATLRVKPAPEALASGNRSVTTISISRTTSRASSLTGYVGTDLSELLRTSSGVTVGINPSAGNAGVTASPTPISLPTSIDTAITVAAVDWTNAALTGASFTVSASGTSPVALSPMCGTTSTSGLITFFARSSTASGTGVVEVTLTSPNLPGGILVLNRFVSFTAASKTATATPLGAVPTTAPTCPTMVPTNTPTSTPTATATSTSTATSTPTVTPTQTVTPTRTAVSGSASSSTTTRSLNPGWNALSLTVDPNGAVTAASTCGALNQASGTGTAVEVARWVSGAWDSYLCGVTTSDWTMVPGTGYVIRLSRAAAWSTTGKPLSAPAGYRLSVGWNLIGPGWVPANATAEWLFTDASSQAAGIGQVVEAVRLRGGAYDPAIKAVTANRFPLEAGAAYFVRVVQ